MILLPIISVHASTYKQFLKNEKAMSEKKREYKNTTTKSELQ